MARTGRIRAADGGTFLLDEVGDPPLITQVKLLRVIERDEVSRLGAAPAHGLDVRYVAVTHRDLEESGGSHTLAARRLGVDRSTLRRRVRVMSA